MIEVRVRLYNWLGNLEVIKMEELGKRILQYFLNEEDGCLPMSINKMDGDGHITTSFPLSAIKDDKLRGDIVATGQELPRSLGTLYIDQIGQMIIHKNIHPFFEYFKDLDDDDYMSKVAECEHVHFGMGCNRDKMTLKFHGGYLYDVLIGMLSQIIHGEH